MPLCAVVAVYTMPLCAVVAVYTMPLCAVVAVEKVTVLARLLSVNSIQNNQRIRTSLAHAFCYLIGSLQDINLYVVERATLYLETIKASSIKV